MISKEELLPLEKELNSPEKSERLNAVQELAVLFRNRQIASEPAGKSHNLHCHTCFSYNGYGYAPAYLAYLARKSGWMAVGIIDFDVLDAVEEFAAAANLFDIPWSCGIETRVFVPELSDCAINSPGEPGIAYHLGLGFAARQPEEAAAAFLQDLRNRAGGRIESLLRPVNAALDPVRLDFQRDVAPLTPNGNVTERHLCRAYREGAAAAFPDRAALCKYWSDKLNKEAAAVEAWLDDPAALEAAIRAATMKQGGVGYIPADPASFPLLRDFNAFILASGAIPAVAWLNGLSQGEADVDRLLDLHLEQGAAMLNIIPDRNHRGGDEAASARLVAELDRVIAACRQRDLPVVIGTEMNAPGQKLADDLTLPALARHTDTFLAGAHILTAHTLFTGLGKGYLSDWAMRCFPNRRDRNAYFERLGQCLTPARFHSVAAWPEDPEKLMILANSTESPQ